jgi:2-methylaconitate cis-trans-isomerase PrpF
MGSPDPDYGRQLNGLGSGISSTSKVVVVSPSARPDADVDYTFVQVGVRDGRLDTAGNCGNMSAVVGPAALDWGLLSYSGPRFEAVEDGAGSTSESHAGRVGRGRRVASVRMFNTNTRKIIVSRFLVTGGDTPRFAPDGDYAMDGVPGTGSRVTLRFLDPAGAKTSAALPTGKPTDELRMTDGTTVTASLVDVANPGVFVRAADVGLNLGPGTVPPSGSWSPATVERDRSLKARLEEIRRAGATKMGLDPDVESVPKVVVLLPRSGAEDDVHLRCLAMSMGQAHKAVPLTLALCLGAAARLPGTIAGDMVREGGRRLAEGEAVSIGHPSGKVDVGTVVQDGRIVSADLHRTARFLMRGEVFY